MHFVGLSLNFAKHINSYVKRLKNHKLNKAKIKNNFCLLFVKIFMTKQISMCPLL